MQPSIVGSSSFGILWTKTYNAKERWYAKPLVYTPPGQKQLVFTASNQNWIRTVDAVTGAPINARQVQPPFLQSDIGCTDMPDTIGISGTPVIDPNTNTAYFFAKGYQNGAASGGVAKGVYQFYAVNVLDLTDRPGFPVLIDGNNADNDPARYFLGGTVLQRPSLTMIGGVVYGTFGGHCDLFNYTGMVTGVSTTAGVGVTSMFAMEAAPGAPPVTLDIMNQKGGKAGIWMSGMAPATDGGRMFVVTGNGQGHENKDTPASGRSPLSTLDEVVANFAVSGSKITLQDYFEPYEYIGMDAGDRDLGSGGVALLDPTVFKGTNGVGRIAVTIGKNGKAYIMNADNLGGFKLGPGATDNILQTIISPNAVFGGAGSYPLEGGYIYFTPVGAQTLAYKLGLDQNGAPLFSKVGQSPDVSAGRVGVGVPTVTTYKGQAGTGIVWVTDVEGGLKAYKAVPDASGTLVKINIPPTGGLNKFQRPAFGDGRLYVTNNVGGLICMGSPVSIPLNCTSPVDFGDVTLGTTKTVKVDCTALIPITKVNGLIIGDKTFQASNASLPQGSLKIGDAFSFPVVWNLTQESIKDAAGASFGAVTPGVKTSSLTISTTNGVAQYSNLLPITLQGNEVSSAPFLSLSPPEVDFGGIVVGSPGAATGLDSSIIIANIGSSPLKITGYGYAGTDMDDDDSGDGSIVYKNTTTTKDGTVIGDGFTSTDLPPVGSTIGPGQSLTVPINFNANKVGNYQSIFNVWTNGGTKYTLLTGSATTAPIAKLAVETDEGGWDTSGIMDFGTVVAGTTETRRLRICNVGGSALLITKSKPPVDAELRAENPTSDLHEGQSIPAGECAYGPVDIAAAPETPNVAPHDVSDVWILNTDDLTFGVHDVEIKATIISRQLGPTYPNGTAKYTYLGCYSDLNPRQLQKSFDLGTSNENAKCQSQCQSLGYTFAGTEYHTQCWCGNLPPAALKYTPESAKKCTFGCAADTLQACDININLFIVFFYILDFICFHLFDLIHNFILDFKDLNLDIIVNYVHVLDILNFVHLKYVDNNLQTFYLHLYESDEHISINQLDYHIQDIHLKHINGHQYDILNHIFNSFSYLQPRQYQLESSRLLPRWAGQICLDYCKSKGTKYAGLEYHRECYCGDSIATDAIANAAGCTSTCKGNTNEICGGSNRMNVYQAVSASGSSTTSSTTSATTTSTKPSSTSSSSTITSPSSSLKPTTTTPSTLTTTTRPLSSTLPTPTASPTKGYNHLGCYAEPPSPTRKPMTQLLSSVSMSPDLCISALSSANNQRSAAGQPLYEVFGLEYGRECWAAATLVQSQTSLVGDRACDLTCPGDGGVRCGGRGMYDYYVSTGFMGGTVTGSVGVRTSGVVRAMTTTAAGT
ncbi:MAG: hypothetical protein Q9220_006733 [cf. Caloplaca sp. 1 TL-2023]